METLRQVLALLAAQDAAMSYVEALENAALQVGTSYPSKVQAPPKINWKDQGY